MHSFLIVDVNKCTGCRVCEMICSLHHEGECNPLKSRIGVFKWEALGIDVPTVCQQCDKPICRAVCTVKAISKDENTGAIRVNPQKCTGCEFCAFACPFDGPTIVPSGKRNKAIICDLCGGDPQCVKFCKIGALTYIKADSNGIDKKLESVKSMLYYRRKRSGIINFSNVLNSVVPNESKLVG